MKDQQLRSANWFGRKGKDGFIYRAWMKNQGIPPDMFEGKPVIGICNTWSEQTPCNAHFAPDGAVIRPSAGSPELLMNQSKVIVFENTEDNHARIDDPDLAIEAGSIMVLKNVGPKGYPGMAEVGNMALPKKLLEKGVTDMVRISDGRMSVTGFGTVVLHVSPEAALGGPLALVKDGDIITLDAAKRSLELEVSEKELAARKKAWKPNEAIHPIGSVHLYQKHVEPAHLGADMDFLKGGSGNSVTRDSH